jgi:cell surface protein SprA
VNPNHKGGKLYFNLGDISEDILRDGRKFFENGLPADGSDENVEFTVWGRVPTIQMIVNAFDNEANARQYQDVGYDGLQDSKERDFFTPTYLDLIASMFGTESEAYKKAYKDPSADNYHFYRGSDYDAEDVKILGRYKHYNNAEGNSPTDSQSPESYPTAAHNIPNVEDMNNDNTLSEEEKYYQYVVNLSPERMVVGENYIVDMYEATPETFPNGNRIATKWYQFRIPIKNPDQVIGGISGFNSIRFLRLFMRDFEEPVYCRFATFELVRTDWRSYSMREDGPWVPGQEEECTFDIATVSFEENSNRKPIPYVLPPGIERESYVGTTVYQVDEKALSMKVVNLNDGESRAIYKNLSYDLRQFKKLKMFVHAEEIVQGTVNQGDITVFVRLGLDFEENYYEYEIPVKTTDWNVGKDTALIWPATNRIDILLDSLVAIKQHRNLAIRNGKHPSNFQPYQETLNGNTVTVVGMPNIADVTTIMIGIRNPKKKHPNDGDDMLPKSLEVWINELRLTDFNERSGFAALARARLNLADVGDLTLSGSYTSPGFGSIEQSITQRSQESTVNFDFATNIDGGKVLFPEKWNIKIPVHYDLSINHIIPEYNPLNPDVKLREDFKWYELYGEKEEKDSVRRMTTTIVQRQNINLMNIRKERRMDKPLKIRPWDIENLDFSYSYSEMKSSDVDVEFDNQYKHDGQIGYTFNYNPKNYKPLSSAKKMKSKWLQIIKDFNFYLMPRNFTFRTTVIRELNEFKLRPKSQGNIIIDTSYVKSFDWNRNYALRWDITQGLKLDYRAVAEARITEPQGLIDTREKKDSVWRSFGNGGRMNNFRQNIDISYQIPIQKIPVFNWITATARYAGDYKHISSPLSLMELGNTLQSSYNFTGNATFNFVTLYNNVPYLKKVNQGNFGKNTTKKNSNKNADKGKNEKNSDKTKNSNEEGTEDGKGKDKDKKKNGINVGKYIMDGSLRFLMMIRSVSGNFTYGEGSVLPGYMPFPNLFGVSFPDKGAPGFLYIFGGQPNIRKMAVEGGWLSKDSMMNTAFQSNTILNYSFRATVEPFKDFRIDVNANSNHSQNYQSFFRSSPENPEKWENYSEQISGNHTMSYFALSTFFTNGDDLFRDFRSIRAEMSKKIAQDRGISEIDPETGYPSGYNGIQQEVLTTAFLATYGGKKSKNINTSTPFLKMPLPNWNVNYTGLTKIPIFKKVFQSFSIVHRYIASYGLGNFTRDILYEENPDTKHPSARNDLNNFIPKYTLSQVSLNEKFEPLVGFDMTLVNSFLLRIEFKKGRNVSMSFTNNQITEMLNNELVISAGYRFKDIKIGLIFSGAKRQIVSDLNLTAGFGLRDNKTTIRKIEENVNQISSGMLAMTIDVAADYQLSKMVGLRFFYKQIINKPKMVGANQYDNTNVDCGISVRLLLNQ